ncbi:MAG: glycosyltransferase family 2 protein [Vicinamibacterales bacterium]
MTTATGVHPTAEASVALDLMPTVVIRNRNESAHLQLVLAALAAQDVPHSVVVVDNASDDDSVEVARRAGATVVPLSKGAFTYGRALNVGLAQASGSVCVILSAHSLPIGPSFLRNCLEPFADPRVAATRCLYAGKRADAQRWMAPETLTSSSDVDTVVSKGPLASGCAVRRRVWEEIPFDETASAAEEKLWALAVLARGYTISSPCHAAYTYLKPIGPVDAILKNGRELIEIHRRTGQKLGFLRRGASAASVDMAVALFRRAPAAAWRAVQEECARTYVRWIAARGGAVR